MIVAVICTDWIASMSRALPLQLEMMMLLGCERIPQRSEDPGECKEVMRTGRRELIRRTGVDFGYNADAWRQYLLQHHRDGYDGYNAFDSYVANKLLDDEYANGLLAELAEEIAT